MKKQNSVSDFTSERNAVLVDHFRRQLALQSQITLNNVFKEVARQPVPRFWVSECRAAVVIGRMLRGDDPLADMYEEKREMYREIFRRVCELRELHPDATIADLVAEVVNQPAPCSYMSWHRARGVIYAEKRRRCAERASR